MKRILTFFALILSLLGATLRGAAETIDPFAAPSTSVPAGEASRRSDDLVGFVGVSAQIAGSDSAWQPVLRALSTLGVRHVRDHAALSGSQAYFDRHGQLGALQIKTLFAAPNGSSQAVLEAFAARVPSDIEGFEVVSGLDAANDPRWIRDLTLNTAAVHRAAAALGLTSVGPTLASPASYVALGDLSGKADLAAIASLPCVSSEAQAVAICNFGVLRGEEAAATRMPFLVTGAALPETAANALPPSIAAVYLPRVLLEEWNAGATRSYRADLDPTSHAPFALVNQSGAETPAFRALSALLGLLRDEGGTFVPGSLQYSLSGVDRSVHHSLFQKRDGSFYLALWIEAPIYDFTTHRTIAVPGQVARLETAHPMTMTTYDFDETGAVTARSAGLSTPQMLPISDRLLIVKLTPPAATTPGSTAAGTTNVPAASTALVNAAALATPENSSSAAPILPATYYVANSGSDSNDGLSPARPWKTIAKVNASTTLFVPGSSILLHRGDIFRDDFLRFENEVLAYNNTTLANTPLKITGTAARPLTIGAYGTGANPLIDGADPLNVSWTRVTGNTWKANVARLPSKVYVDSTTAETTALVPQANAAGAWRSNTPYKFLDLVTSSSGNAYIAFAPEGTLATPSLPYGQPWQSITNSVANNSSQTFSATKSGLQNVEATPGSWYGSGSTVYVHLADGSNPNAHTIEGTYRQYGVLLLSVNYITVQDLSIERVLLDGIALGTYAHSGLAGHYYTNEYNSVLNNKVWNWGNQGFGCLPVHGGCGGTIEAGILSKAYAYGEALRGTTISGNTVGRSDQYFGMRAQQMVAGIQAAGQNAAIISNNSITTVNSQCLNYVAYDYTPSNLGGDIGYNYCGNNQGNFFFGTTTGGRLHHNVAANSFGEGIQIGGNDNGGLIDHNLLYNIWITASRTAFNGIDCNGNGHYMTLANNTIVNVWAASITLEGGCDHAYVVNNIIDQPQGNTGLFYDWVVAYSPSATFRNNLYSFPSNVHPWQHAFTLPTWKAYSGEYDARQANPVFVNAAAGDYRLAGSSVGAGLSLSITGISSEGDLGAGIAAP